MNSYTWKTKRSTGEIGYGHHGDLFISKRYKDGKTETAVAWATSGICSLFASLLKYSQERSTRLVLTGRVTRMIEAESKEKPASNGNYRDCFVIPIPKVGEGCSTLHSFAMGPRLLYRLHCDSHGNLLFNFVGEGNQNEMRLKLFPTEGELVMKGIFKISSGDHRRELVDIVNQYLGEY